MGFVQAAFFFILLPLLHVFSEDDSACLQQFRASVTDPIGSLANWELGKNSSKYFVCSFTGVTCWNGQENRVLALNLRRAGLSGQFPSGLSLCTSIQNLDLSSNSFSGSLPDNICRQMPYLTSADLSQNTFTGAIPDNLADCTYLNSLNLQQNQLTGTLPWRIGVLPRLTTLDLSSNLLSGVIPSSYTNRSAIGQAPFPASDFENNSGLCGAPLTSPCPPSSSGPDVGVIVGAGMAVVTFCAVVGVLYFAGFCSVSKTKRSKVGGVDASPNTKV